MTPTEIKDIVKETLRQLGKLETVIVKSEACRRYGRTRVEKLTKKGFLNPSMDEEGGSIWYNVAELEEVMSRNNVLEKFKLPKKQKTIKNK